VTSDIFLCPDCEQPTATAPDSLCSTCAQWRKEKEIEMDEYWHAGQRRRERLGRMRMSPGERFGEELSDMVKGLERSKQ